VFVIEKRRLKRKRDEGRRRGETYSLAELGTITGSHAVVTDVAARLGRGDEGHAHVRFLLGFDSTNKDSLGSIEIIATAAHKEQLAISGPCENSRIPKARVNNE
jgi:hypothetical protein